ncbi:MAG: hypothetical protein IJK81_07115 [Selenomonadaceae bacterium]|nr:hypothetical protein [Selenomonadaceae bacterium]
MQKFLKSLVVGSGLIIGSQFMAIPTVAAQDVYIQSDSGRDIYIVTESIDTNGVDYVHVTLKYIKNARLTYTEHRIYGKASDGMWWLSSEEAKRDNLRATRVWEPNKDKILQYCLSY